MTTKRIILGEKHDIAALVNTAIADVGGQLLDVNAARQSLLRMGHQSPNDETVIRYAREKAILANLTVATGANFNGQIGKITFTDTEKAISQVNDYLNRRNQGHRSQWGK